MGSLKPSRWRNSLTSFAWMSIGMNRSTGSPDSRTIMNTAVSERKTTSTVWARRESAYAQYPGTKQRRGWATYTGNTRTGGVETMIRLGALTMTRLGGATTIRLGALTTTWLEGPTVTRLGLLTTT